MCREIRIWRKLICILCELILFSPLIIVLDSCTIDDNEFEKSIHGENSVDELTTDKKVLDGEEGELVLKLELLLPNRSDHTHTKSSLEVGESHIESLNIILFANGVEQSRKYYDATNINHISLKFKRGLDYSLYVLANVGELDYGQDVRERINIHFSSSSLPMAGKLDLSEEDIRSATQTIAIPLSHLSSKINFSINQVRLVGASIQAVRLCQVASNIEAFSTESCATETSDGDYASAEDIHKLNNGETISFYALENCQGELLPENRDVWAKVPDSIAEKAGLCTYLEVLVAFDGTGSYSGNVKYRMYLGQNSTSNFSLHRNKQLNLRLHVSETGYNRSSWKVDESELISSETIGNMYVSIPKYLGEWGYVEIPQDIADTEAAEIYIGKDNLSQYFFSFGQEDYDQYSFPNGVEMFYDYEAGTNRLYFYSTAIKSSDTVYVDILYRNGRHVVAIPPPICPEYSLPTSPIRVCEDGFSSNTFYIGLKDASGQALNLSNFMAPTQVVSSGNVFGGSRSKIYEDIYIKPLKMTIPNCVQASLVPSDIYSRIEVKGLNINNLAYINLRNDKLSQQFDLPITVYPAFPLSRNIGIVYNYQLAEGDLHSLNASIDLYGGQPSSKNANLEIRKMSPEYMESLSDEAWNNSTNEHTSFIANVSENQITFLEPTFDDQTSLQDMFANGRYIIKSEVVNPITNRRIKAYHSVDICLFLPIICQMEFGDRTVNGFEMGYDYKPCTRFSRHIDSEHWNFMFERIQVYARARNMPQEQSCLLQVESDKESSLWHNHRTEGISSYQYSYGDWSGACAVLPSMADYYDFGFLTSDSATPTTEYQCVNKTHNYNVKLVRYCDYVSEYDSATRGLNRYLIEARYRNFDDY